MMQNQLPIAVDLDGTLIREESHWVFWKYLCRSHPLRALSIMLLRIRRGPAVAKDELLKSCPFEHFRWSLNIALLEKLQHFAASGAPLVLVTGAPLLFAQHMSEKLGLFEAVLASTRHHNLVGREKIKALRTLRFQDFIYVGNSVKDLVIWRASAQAWVVKPSWFVRILCRLTLRDPLFLP